MQFKPWLGVNRFWKLFEPYHLPLPIRFDLIGKPQKYVALFLSFQYFFHASPVTTFLALTHCLHYCVASFNYDDSGDGM